MITNKKTIYKELKKTFDSIDSERSVVGGLLIDPCLDRVLGTGLVSNDFIKLYILLYYRDDRQEDAC
jgi:hypothetical protein